MSLNRGKPSNCDASSRTNLMHAYYREPHYDLGIESVRIELIFDEPIRLICFRELQEIKQAIIKGLK